MQPRHLPGRGRRCGRHVPAAAGEPVVPGKAGYRVEHHLARQLPHAHGWAADHQDDLAIIPGRITDLAEPPFQALTRQMLHGPLLAGPIPSFPTYIPELHAAVTPSTN